MARVDDPVWGGMPSSLVEYRANEVLTDAAGALARSAPFHGSGVVLRLLAEACAGLATELAEDGWRPLARATWLDALGYLELASVLDAQQHGIALALLDGRPWPGTLAELVIAAKGVSSD